MSDIQMHYLKQMKRLKYKITMARILLFAGFITLWDYCYIWNIYTFNNFFKSL